MMKRIFSCFSFICFCFCAEAQVDVQKIQAALPVIDKLFKEYAVKNHFPAIAYGLVVNNKLIATGSAGYINIDQKTAAAGSSHFRIASMTKSFTAMAVLKLRDEGKLRLDDPAYLYIPELKDQYVTTDAPVITIRHLLTHSAGFPEDNPWGDRQLARTDEALTALLKKGISFSTPPSSGYEYSNLGFALLGLVIKKASGQPYQQYINQNILAPLGMMHTYWEYNDVPPAQLAHGYRWRDSAWEEQPLLHDGAWGAMGGLITTIEDFSKYVALHLSAWPARNGAETGPVKRSSVREMQYPWDFSGLNAAYTYPSGKACAIASAYGYGLRWQKDCGGRLSIGHSGGLPGFGSNWQILPDYGIGIILFANATYAATSYINTLVLDTLITLAGLKPRPLPVSPVLQQRKEALVKLLPHWEGAAASGIFAENFFLDYNVEALKKQTAAIFSKMGPIIRVHEMVPENALRGSFVIEGEKGNIEIKFTLTPENPPLIQQYSISAKR